MLYHDVRCSLTLYYTLRNKNVMLQMMMKVMLLTYDRLSQESERSLKFRTHKFGKECVFVVIRYIIFVSIHASGVLDVVVASVLCRINVYQKRYFGTCNNMHNKCMP